MLWTEMQYYIIVFSINFPFCPKNPTPPEAKKVKTDERETLWFIQSSWMDSVLSRTVSFR